MSVEVACETIARPAFVQPGQRVSAAIRFSKVYFLSFNYFIFEKFRGARSALRREQYFSLLIWRSIFPFDPGSQFSYLLDISLLKYLMLFVECRTDVVGRRSCEHSSFSWLDDFRVLFSLSFYLFPSIFIVFMSPKYIKYPLYLLFLILPNMGWFLCF